MSAYRNPGGFSVLRLKYFFLLLLLVYGLAAQEYPPVEADIWIELDSPADDLDPVGLGRARQLADKEALFLLSGMVYGYTFSYRPSDRERGIGEEFILELAASISEDALVPVDVRGRDSRAMLLYRYYPGREEHLRISGWLSAAIPSVMGYGEERAVLGHEGKMEAYRRALKEAVREYARPRMRNKPMRLEGELLLIDTPSVSIVAGRYAVKMRLKINLNKTSSYGSY
ncbi:hypothetical protein [Marispirochaeta sp.]|uniref:hypothetical protein n=1 Tax=Marispirochaeta sp. TaxID=2038653 RepID=UPI0029C8C3EC|nr:hypothetical protein [Marispirochaeta sp.]